MIQSAYNYSQTLGAPKNQFPEDTSIHQILDDSRRREAFEHDLKQLAGRVEKNSTPETELFYQVCYEAIYTLMFGGVDGEGKVWLPYGDFTSKLDDKETQQAYKMALEEALKIFRSQQAEFAQARDALYRLGMFWYMRGMQ